MFYKQYNHYSDRFYIARDVISKMNIKAIQNSLTLTDEDVKQELKGNTEKAQQLCKVLAKGVTNATKIDSYSYAAAVTVLADILGIDYDLFCGYALNKSVNNFDKLCEQEQKIGYSENNLPDFVNIMYVNIEDTLLGLIDGSCDFEPIYCINVEME